MNYSKKNFKLTNPILKLNFILEFVLLSFFLLNSSCQNFPIKSRIEEDEFKNPSVNTVHTIPTAGSKTKTAANEPVTTTETSVPPSTSSILSSTPNAPPPATIPQNGATQSGIPKIGIIIGPGHLRAFIAAGILQEFQKARMPIHALVGLEWGAIPAALYSMHGQANEIEWQMMKLKESQLPKKSLISQELASEDISRLAPFFNDAFANQTFDQLKIPFTCLGLDLKNRQYYWMKRGEVARVISNCVTHPPFYKSSNNFVGGVDLKLASDYLKQTGANYIIFINLIPLSGNAFDDNTVGFESQVLWGEYQQQLARNSAGVVDFMIDTTSINNKSIDFNNRREMIRKGQDVGAAVSKKLSQKLGF